MAGFNGSGTFVRTYNWTNDANNNIKIRSDRMDTEDDGFATGLSTAICKDGQTTTTALIPFALGLSIAAGSAASPTFTITGDVDTGIYAPAANTLGFTTGGVLTAKLTATAFSMIAGSAASPAYTFTANTADGFYSIGAGQIGVSTNGVLRATFADAGVTLTGTLSGTSLSASSLFKAASGTAANPSYTFTANTADGLFSTSAGLLGMTTNGVQRVLLDSNGNFVFGTAAIATNATNGFIYIDSCAGTPTGAPTSYTGRLPLVYDSTNNKIYVYNGAWKATAALT